MKSLHSFIAGFACTFLLWGCGTSVGPSAVEKSVDITPITGNAVLEVLSNRLDLISGGDVLVAVTLDSAESLPLLELNRNGTNVTDVLQPSADNPLRLLGVVSGLNLGENELALNIGNAVTVTNHPIGGPVFTGPQIQPWVCQGSAVDAQCNQPVEYSLHYISTNPNNSGLQPYDPDNPPNDVAMTTTDNGETLPFIVRRETGYQARDQYGIFTLIKEGEEWNAAQPQSQWNRRLLVTHGGNCRGHHETSSPRFDDYAGTIPANPAIAQSFVTALGLGWSVLSTSQLNLGHNCNLSYQAESLMMAKERFIEQYGELRYTVGTGCSGGAITQNMIANAYPGLYQGLLTTCTYPDVMSTATQFADYHILLRYFADNSRHGNQQFPVPIQNEIFGHQNGAVNAELANSALFAEAVDPASSCGGVSAEERYDQNTNPGGVRCDVLTFMENMVGIRQPDRWSQIEQDLGRGFAGFPLGNLGVQYGLVGLQNGVISPFQFLELNTRIGGIDQSLNVTAERLPPDYPALPNAFRTGILNTIVNMDTVPIINMTGPDPGAAHDSVHGYWVRYRFDREFGHHDNHVMWGGPAPLIGDPNYMNMSLIAMAQWLDAIELDTSETELAQKIISNKPADIHDQCSDGNGNFVRDEMCTDEEMLVFGTPRTSAGDDIFGDMVQCVLRPFSRDDNYGLGNFLFQEADWQRLEAAFTTTVDGVTGPFVCDYSQKPLEWQPTVTWLSYQDELGAVITGGEQMEPAPFPPGWASPAFNRTWEPGWQQP